MISSPPVLPSASSCAVPSFFPPQGILNGYKCSFRERQLHFQEAFFRGHGSRRPYSVRNIAVLSCMQKELSWCHGISKGLRINKISYFHPHIKEDCKQSRKVIR
ncbi:hypothetical protein OROHE_001343 [Orobanche hederae]